MAKKGTQRLMRVVLSEQIKEQLIEDIFHHKYNPGDKLVESSLAKEFNVSQTSIREALRSLISMGFLESEPFKGITVRSLTREDLEEVYIVRGALESLAATTAVDRITDEEIGELEDICDRMIEASQSGDVSKRIHLNIDFHEKLIEFSGNKLLMKLFKNLQFESWSMMTGNFATMDPIEMASRHKIVIDAIKTRNKVLVKKAMYEHIETGSKTILDNLGSDFSSR